MGNYQKLEYLEKCRETLWEQWTQLEKDRLSIPWWKFKQRREISKKQKPFRQAYNNILKQMKNMRFA